jgi:hypothetical protein
MGPWVQSQRDFIRALLAQSVAGVAHDQGVALA